MECISDLLTRGGQAMSTKIFRRRPPARLASQHRFQDREYTLHLALVSHPPTLRVQVEQRLLLHLHPSRLLPRTRAILA
jgi:hypothetical protein